jgi:uroporphyrinogen-III synthase
MRSVLVTRPQPAADEFAEKLRRDGYAAYVAPMMEYVAVEANVADLVFYQALIFTSAQAAEVFATLSPERTQPVLAVGDTTAAAAKKAGFANVHSAKGNSNDVAALVRAETPKLHLKKILHPCSADTPDDIGKAVASLGVEVVNRPIYKAKLVDDMPQDVVEALQKGTIDVVMLFSARTAENFVKLMVQKGLKDLSPKLEVICISAPVASALKGLPWHVSIARQPRMEDVMRALKEQDKKAQDRRHRPDRRLKMAYHDTPGHVRSDAYAGPERRQIARRAHEQQQRKRVWQEKVKFLNRSMLTFSFMFIAIVLAGVFLMLPEYAQLKPGHHRRHAEASGDSPFDTVKNYIDSFMSNTDTVTTTVNQIASTAADLVLNPGPGDFSQVLSNVAAMRKRQGGDAAVSQSIGSLRTRLAAPDVRKPEDVDRVVSAARREDGNLDNMLGSIKHEDVEAGVMLLVLNEFRGNVNNNRPYAADLELLKKLTGNDPRMSRALEHMAPYAETGVMNRQALQAELKGLAGDIVTAQMQGQDVSVQQAAKARLDKLSRAAKADDVKGAGPDAVVARAQILLDQGDVPGAMRQLESLKGASATAAGPWMNDATSHVAAGRASDDLTEGVLQTISGAGPSSVADLMTSLKESLTGPSVPYLSPSFTGRGATGGSNVLAPAPGAP